MGKHVERNFLLLTLFVLMIYDTKLVNSFFTSQPIVIAEFFNGSYHTKVLERNESLYFPDLEKLFGKNGNSIKKLQLVNLGFVEIDVKEMKRLPKLETLEVQQNKKLRKIKKSTFFYNPKLYHLYLHGNALDDISVGAFNGLFQNEGALCELHLQYNKIRHFPVFTKTVPGLKHLNLDGNPIENLLSNALVNLTHIEDLTMKETLIGSLPNGIFINSIGLHKLQLNGNSELTTLGDETFVGARNLKILDLSGTGIHRLPHKGLERLSELKIESTPNLWEITDQIVGIPTLKNVRVAENQRWLCCAFDMKRAVIHLSIYRKKFNRTSLCPDPKTTSIATSTPSTTTYDPFAGVFGGRKTTEKSSKNGVLSTTQNPLENFNFGKRRKREVNFFGSFLKNNGSSKRQGNQIDNPFTDDFIHHTPKIHTRGVICNPNITGMDYAEDVLAPVVCSPGPDALRPCDDIMGNVFLTSVSWLISIIALLGNSMVFCVLLLSRRTVSVTKFLLINLSFADLCLALYLFILVSASTHTHGNYYNYVREWQFSGGCSIAGFLAIFSSQMSMLVLVIITIERYFAIVHAMHFHRRVSMNHAVIGICIAWLISLFVAVLPLVGVNSYNEVAICLPFRTQSSGDLAYIGIILLMNLLFFLFVFSSYLRMFWVVRSPHLNSNHQQRNDSEVAKRMALLVFSDFFCWAPIAFIGLWSAFGDTGTLGVTVKNSKFLLVVFFPINSLCNPFLYAVSTNSFKRDFYDLLIRCGLFQDCIARANENVYTNTMSQKQSARNHSETITLTSSFGRSIGRSPSSEKNNLLTKVLAKRVKLDHQNSQSLPNTPERNSPSTPIVDDVFTPMNGSTDNPFFPATVSIQPLSMSENAEESSQLLQQSSGDKTFDDDNVSGDSKQTRRKTAGFSRYDLSPEAFHKSKETTCV